jgi:phage nucleotide-binding protein
MAIEITNTGQVENLAIKGCVYGPSGMGKTVLMRTLPGRKVIIGSEKGELSLSRVNQMRVFGNYEEIPIIRIKSAADLREAYELVAGHPVWSQCDSVGVDSISDIAESILSEKLGAAKDPRKGYGETQEVVAKYIRLFRDLPNKHVMMTAKQDREQDANGAVMYQPSMPGKTLTQGLAYFFDYVFALQISPKDANGVAWRYLRCKPDNQFSAKDRSGSLDEMEKPNLAEIITKIKQAK